MAGEANYTSLDAPMSVDPNGPTKPIPVPGGPYWWNPDKQDWEYGEYNWVTNKVEPIPSPPPKQTPPVPEQPNMSVAPPVPEQPNMSVAPPVPPAQQQPAQQQPAMSVDGTVIPSPGAAAQQPIEIRIEKGRYVPPTIVRPALMTPEQLASAQRQVAGADLQRGIAQSIAEGAQQDYAKAISDAQSAMQDEQQRYEARAAEIARARAAEIEAADKRIAESAVDPTKYISSMSTGQKAMSVLAVLLGGLGAALTRSDRNLAIEVLQQQIDRDIEAQKSKLQTSKEMREAVERKYGSIENWEHAMHAEKSAAVMQTLSLAAARADSDAKQAALIQDEAAFSENAIARGIQRSQQLDAARSLTRPVMAGGGMTQQRIENREEVIARLAAVEPDPTKRTALIEKYNKAPDNVLIAAATAHGIAPATGGGAAEGRATEAEKQRATLDETIAQAEAAQEKAQAAGDTTAASAIGTYLTYMRAKRASGTEMGAASLQLFSPQPPPLSAAWDTMKSYFGGTPASTRAFEYLQQEAKQAGK
jgi:hypothetical protein